MSTTQSIATGISRGASAGAAVGSVVPIFGTAIGAIIGAVAGWADAAFNRQDPEVQNFDQAQAISRANGPEAVVNIQNKYLVLAGLFDLETHMIKGNIPIVRKYGRFGEFRFVTDMCNLVYNAAQAGQISPNDNAQTVFARIVQPWIDSFGFGPMQDSNGDMINYILMGMLAEYFAGLNKRWYARGGDYPFGGLPPFSLPGAVPPTSSATPSPQTAGPAFNQPQIAVAPTPVDPLTQQLNAFQSGTIPTIGTVLWVTKGTKGEFLKTPAKVTFSGVDPATGGWIVSYGGAQYMLDSGSLHTYAPMQMVAQPAPSSQLGPPAGTTTIQVDPGYSYNVPAAPPTGGGGGGGYYSAPVPQSVTPLQAAPAPSGGFSNQTLMLAGGGALLLVLLLKGRRGASV